MAAAEAVWKNSCSTGTMHAVGTTIRTTQNHYMHKICNETKIAKKNFCIFTSTKTETAVFSHCVTLHSSAVSAVYTEY